MEKISGEYIHEAWRAEENPTSMRMEPSTVTELEEMRKDKNKFENPTNSNSCYQSFNNCLPESGCEHIQHRATKLDNKQ